MELFVLQFLLVITGLGFVFFNIVEPIYVFFYNKPLVVHSHLLPRRISDEQRNILAQNFPFYNKLSPSKKRYFEHRIKSLSINMNLLVMKLRLRTKYLCLSLGLMLC